MFAYLKRLMARQATAGKARTRTKPYIPQFEALEDRQLLAVAVNGIGTGVLDIVSNNAQASRNETVTILDNGSSQNGNIRLKITGFNNNQTFTVPDTVRDINVTLKDGTDKVTYNLQGDLQADATRTVKVDLGNGKDTFAMGLTRDFRANSKFTLGVDGGAGADTIDLTAIPTTAVLAGRLTQIVDPWVIAAGAKFDVSLNGGLNKDTIRFQHLPVAPGAQIIQSPALAAQVDGTLQVNMDGAEEDDTLVDSLVANVGPAGLHKVSMFGKTGKDKLSFIPTINPLFGVVGKMELSMDGGDQSDILTAVATANVAATGVLDVKQSGGQGADTASFNLGGKLDGKLLLNVDGGTENDTLSAILNIAVNSQGSVGNLDVEPKVAAIVQGGVGNDTMTFRIKTSNARILAKLQGGADTDTGTHSDNVEALSTAEGGDIETVIQQDLL